jgi:hypothetical protein
MRNFQPAPASSADEGTEQPNLSDLVAKPARSRPLAAMEMHADDLERADPSFAKPLRPAERYSLALIDRLLRGSTREQVTAPHSLTAIRNRHRTL